MVYGVCFYDKNITDVEERIYNAYMDKGIDAIILVLKEKPEKYLYSRLIRKCGEDLNLYIVPGYAEEEKNAELIQNFCKVHLGYKDEYKIVMC